MRTLPRTRVRPARRRLEVEQLEDRLVMAGSINANVAFSVVNDWGSGFQASMDITNRQTTAINGWRIEFDFDRSIGNIWNAQVVSHTGTHYVIKDAGYNAMIAPGATINLGFLGTPGKVTTPPANYLLNDSSLGSSNPTTPPPSLPTLSIADVSVLEGNAGSTAAKFLVTLSQASTQTVTVKYATANESAIAGSDYAAATSTLTFAPGQTQQTITVSVTGDTTNEPNETFLLNLSSPSGATLAVATARGTIVNDDSAGLPPFNYGEAFQKALFFYEATRSGDLPDNYRVDWRGDSGMSDGADVGVDLTGGYYDAGDHVKFAFPMAGAMTLLAWGLVQYRDAYAKSGQLDRALEGLKWGTDWLVKAHTAPNEFWGQVGRGDLDHSAWVEPEVMQMARPSYKIDAQHPGSDLAGEAAAALAAASLVFRVTDPTYADTLLQHAIQLYNFADTYRGKYSDSITDAASYYNSYSGYQDELAWGAAWLYKATGNQAYLTKAQAVYDANFAGQTMTWTQSWDDKRYGTVVLLAQLTGKQQYRTDAERWLDYWTVGINGGATRITYTPGGLAFLNGWGSLRYSATTSFLALIYSDTVRDYNGRYHNFALGQINYILGQNPANRSYEVGFGNNPPVNAHHRGASGVWDGNVANPAPNRHILYGALVGGPESISDFDYHDDRTNYISNEVALDYNAGFTGALARLYLEYGGQPLSTFPIPDVRDKEFFVEASINQQGSTFTEVRALLNNRSAWPARFSSDLGFRYFVDLSETYAAGYSASDVVVQSYYSQGATLSVLRPWDTAKHLYYVDVSFTGVPIGPGAGTFQKEAQVRIGLKSGLPAAAWDPTNDWSYQGLVLGRDQVKATAKIPVYEFGTSLLYGQLPSAFVPTPPSGSPPPPTNPPPSQSGAFAFKMRDDWGAGFVADVTIRNTKTTAINGWVVEFDFPYEITSIWNAEIVSHTGNHYVIRAAPWNGTIQPGGEVTFGFQGVTGNVKSAPTNVTVDGVPV